MPRGPRKPKNEGENMTEHEVTPYTGSETEGESKAQRKPRVSTVLANASKVVDQTAHKIDRLTARIESAEEHLAQWRAERDQQFKLNEAATAELHSAIADLTGVQV